MHDRVDRAVEFTVVSLIGSSGIGPAIHCECRIGVPTVVGDLTPEPGGRLECVERLEGAELHFGEDEPVEAMRRRTVHGRSPIRVGPLGAAAGLHRECASLQSASRTRTDACRDGIDEELTLSFDGGRGPRLGVVS